METLLYPKLHASVCTVLFLLLLLLLLQFHSLAYTVPDKFFINCGSDTNVTDSSSGRTFIGETERETKSSSIPFIFPKHGSSKEKESNHSATPPLYQTARLFHGESEYKFRIEKHGYHLLRLHFFAFVSSKGNLSSAHFNVSVPGFCLLNNFTPQNNKPLIEEFFIIINTNNFRITFSPIQPNLAFINAIELFLLPNTFIPKVRKFHGLELMEIIEKTSSGPMVKEEQNSHHHSRWHCPWHMCGNLKLLAILGAVALVSVIAVVFFVCLKQLKKLKHDESVDWLPMEKKGGGSSHSHSRYGSSSHGSSSSSSSSSSYSHVPNLNKIRFDELQVATNNFDQNWVIGKGCFGTVYKGLLNNGLRVAVKRTEPGLLQQPEIKILLRIRHRHLVSLMGYCDERSEMILVYEYMEKGTLRDHLHNSNLCWIQRLEICIGAARGLNYLHNGSSCRGINNVHSHVKCSNILLDENNVAKISGFGLSRKDCFDEKMKCDHVYSFGLVLVEVVCGRVAMDAKCLGGEWGSICKKKGRLEEIVDPCIKCEIDGKSLRKFGETVDKCLRKKGCCMGDVLWDLEYALQLQRGAIQTITHTHHSNAATQEMAILKHDQLNAAVNYYSVL